MVTHQQLSMSYQIVYQQDMDYRQRFNLQFSFKFKTLKIKLYFFLFKSQTCDGLSLTFWVLTEINGRPLNLFFKENEVRDRLNAVGRDISILVQPSDLIVKLKKQLKSLRGYKDYIVQ